MLVSGAENVNPVEVGEALHPSVAEVTVIGLPDEHWGETVTAFVVARPDASIEPDELVAFARQGLADY